MWDSVSTRESEKESQGERKIKIGNTSLTLPSVVSTITVILLLCSHARASDIYIDGGRGFTIGGTSVDNSDINIALFARYRINKWEIHGGGWHSPERDVSNVTVGAGYVFRVGESLNFTGGLALADKSANIGTQLRFYLAGRYDFRCWSVGYVHYSNGDEVLDHDELPNDGVNLLVLGRKVEC